MTSSINNMQAVLVVVVEAIKESINQSIHVVMPITPSNFVGPTDGNREVFLLFACVSDKNRRPTTTTARWKKYKNRPAKYICFFSWCGRWLFFSFCEWAFVKQTLKAKKTTTKKQLLWDFHHPKIYACTYMDTHPPVCLSAFTSWRIQSTSIMMYQSQMHVGGGLNETLLARSVSSTLFDFISFLLWSRNVKFQSKHKLLILLLFKT